jgi:hypothetical protein
LLVSAINFKNDWQVTGCSVSWRHRCVAPVNGSTGVGLFR